MQIGMNTAGDYLRGIAGIENAISPGIIEPLPAPTPFLQTVDNGATPGQLINYVTGAFIQSTASGALALLKMPVDLLMGNFNALKDDSTDALTMLLGFKTGEIIAKVSDFKLIIKQMTLDAELVAQGVISKSPLEFLKNGPDGLQLNIIKDKVIDPANPAAPPVEVTKILTSEQLAQECSNSLVTNANGSVEFQSPFGPDPVCFVAGTLVHTKEGLRPIEQIKVGDYVLSKPESGEGEQAYKRVTQTFVREDQEVWVVDYAVDEWPTPELPPTRSLVVTGNHPFWVDRKGWTAARDLKQADNLELYNTHETKEFGYLLRSLKVLEADRRDWGWAEDSDILSCGKGPMIDLRDGGVKVSEYYKEDVPTNDLTGRYLRQQVFNLEVEDFHTYFVGEAGVWVHNACPDVAGTVQGKGVVLNNAAEANAGLAPSPNATVYSSLGAEKLAKNLGAGEDALILVEQRSGASTPTQAQGSMSLAGGTKVAEWGLISNRSLTKINYITV
jgi:hypothetical protein